MLQNVDQTKKQVLVSSQRDSVFIWVLVGLDSAIIFSVFLGLRLKPAKGYEMNAQINTEFKHLS